jgi:hypothetical protein
LGEPNFDSYVVSECHRLRKIPLRDLTDEQLRLAIGQKIGLRYLLPLAIERLKADPFASGHFYEGDLLQNVLRVPTSAWEERPDLREELLGIADRFFAEAKDLEDSWHEIVEPEVRAVYSRFIAQQK